MRLLLPGFLLLVPLMGQTPAELPAEELARAPSAWRIATLLDEATAQGWGSITPLLRTGAQQAYEANSGYAGQWYYLYRWARLLGTPSQKATTDWIQAIDAARVAHPNMATSYALRPGSLAGGLSRELLLALLGNAALSEEFFQLLSPVDQPQEVLAILQKIHQADPARFSAYGSLALAVAVVHDVPVSPYWPHGQVAAEVLRRQPPPPEELFAYLTRLDRSGLTLHRLARLPASELKFLVDIVAPFSELDWARQNASPGLDDLGRAYDLIRYRQDRFAANQYNWPGPVYTLPVILQQGGICVDQAYFASTTGKAKGVPTIMFRGAGLDGRHAWFGYLGANQQWQLDCGRYAEQKYVTGLAFDPQTWGNINDHELLFIAERFRELPTYKLSVLHAAFAVDYLGEGKVEAAWKAARESVNRDRRNVNGWQILLAAQGARSPDLRAREALLREAVLAFQKYPDLEVAFSTALIDILRQRGESSLADFEEQRLGKKYQSVRQDLSTRQAAATLKRSMANDDMATQIKVFNRMLETAGRGAGHDFYDVVVSPFLLHLAGQGQVPAALRSLERVRRTLRVEPRSQLDSELTALAGRLRSGKFENKAPGE
ncbi:hypothetical protein Verru16b_02715 [Lacunisphaera limnophila]|uniref:Uncharacterized protein n=1 Tax=Lacunisphaera limnophila TaxID=1838286 RepID=A0A1D8AXM4_9BACT|nr:hypothetical protein [Lacunisphaera limnophila]AOS45631.1 hypothetical protein Verru16b_02715 [Lacunisphaera limnophila]